MLALRVLVALGESKIDDVNSVFRLLVAANHEVVGLDVTMDDPLLVDFLNALNHLH